MDTGLFRWNERGGRKEVINFLFRFEVRWEELKKKKHFKRCK